MEFLLENPPILAMTVLVLLLVLSIPIGIFQARRKKAAGEPPPASAQRSAFMGTGFDLAILLFGILVLIAIVMSVIHTFS